MVKGKKDFYVRNYSKRSKVRWKWILLIILFSQPSPPWLCCSDVGVFTFVGKFHLNKSFTMHLCTAICPQTFPLSPFRKWLWLSLRFCKRACKTSGQVGVAGPPIWQFNTYRGTKANLNQIKCEKLCCFTGGRGRAVLIHGDRD